MDSSPDKRARRPPGRWPLPMAATPSSPARARKPSLSLPREGSNNGRYRHKLYARGSAKGRDARRSPARSQPHGRAAPEAAAGGTLALVQDGDIIELDVPSRRLHLHVTDKELRTRRKAWSPPPAHTSGGYQYLYVEHVLQADEGADLDFLVGQRGAAVPRESH